MSCTSFGVHPWLNQLWMGDAVSYSSKDGQCHVVQKMAPTAIPSNRSICNVVSLEGVIGVIGKQVVRLTPLVPCLKEIIIPDLGH